MPLRGVGPVGRARFAVGLDAVLREATPTTGLDPVSAVDAAIGLPGPSARVLSMHACWLATPVTVPPPVPY